tara:strand:+ start:16146 stop:16592 length:447 start_codon:yes stop_codon:yes gene_type:complete
MGLSTIAKKVVSRGLSIGKKVAKVAGGAAVLGLGALHTLGKKEMARLEAEHPKNNPPPLPTLKQNTPYDKVVVKRKVEAPPQKEAKGIERVDGKVVLSKDRVAMGLSAGPQQDPMDAAEDAAKRANQPKGKSGGLSRVKNAIPNPFKK